MFTLRQVLRTLVTVAVPALLSVAVNRFFPKKEEVTPPNQFLPVLKDIGFVPQTFPVTYRFDEAADFDNYERVHNVTTGTPDTTAVLLNWARFPNTLLITSLLCGPWLEDTIAEVVIWNNSPRQLSYEQDLKITGCRRSKLRIINAPGNMYFQGRFLACAGASTPYCFIQDDDYLIRPEIIKALRTRIEESAGPHAIHLLPPHEHLSSALRETHVPKSDSSHISDIHTSFAWLGHGTMMHRTKSEEFLALLRRLRVPQDEMKMADNYFAILGNRVPETWFDQDFGLGGGHAFTVGSDGEERNKKHILRAAEYLDSLAKCGAASCDQAELNATPARVKVPYTSLAAHPLPSSWTRAACRGAACVLETNIRVLPANIAHASNSINRILSLEAQNLAVIGEEGKQRYETYPLSHAVDTRPDTAFQSFGDGKEGDTVVLDILADISSVHEWQTVEMVLLVDRDTEKLLQASTFASSADGEHWREASQRPICDDTKLLAGEAGAPGTRGALRECSIQMVVASTALHLRATGRYFRIRLTEDRPERWSLHEMWLRGL